MRTALKISVSANLILAAVVWYQAPHRPSPTTGETPQTQIAGQVDQGANLTAPLATVSPRFDWREVEAPEYPTYIAKLRAIRCPEQTIRDIITADVANLFALKRKESPADYAAAGRWSSAEESRLVAALFGDPVDPHLSDGRSGDPASEAVEVPVRLPLVLQTRALGTLKLTDEQKGELGELTQQFIKEIGGVNQNPKDPAYLAKWRQAQPKFDEMIIRTIGRRALVDLDEAIPTLDAGAE
jgi:hypothetical protein